VTDGQTDGQGATLHLISESRIINCCWKAGVELLRVCPCPGRGLSSPFGHIVTVAERVHAVCLLTR